MKRFALLLTALIGGAGAAIAQTSIIIPAQTISVPAGPPGPAGTSPTPVSVATALAGNPSFVAAVAAAMTSTPPVVTPPVTTPPVTTPPAAGTAWGYFNGVFSWGGDYSYPDPAPSGVTTGHATYINYSDTTGVPLSGSKDVSVSTTGFGAWQPVMCINNLSFPGCSKIWTYSTAGYTKLTFALKPTQANQAWQVYFVGVGDVSLNCSPLRIDSSAKYGPAPKAGVWATYSIKLSDLCVGSGANVNVYKFGIQDQTGAANTWYADNVGFSP